jgi:hypothetical protein
MIDKLLATAKLNDGTPLQYALGLEVSAYHGLKTVSHEGEWAGYRAELLRFPEQHFSVIILGNCSPSMVPARLAHQIAEICLEDQMHKAEAVAEVDSAATPPELSAPEDLSRYAGFYRNPSDELVRQIAVKDGQLVYMKGAAGNLALAPIGPARFRMLDVPIQTEVTFTSSAGHVNGMEVNSTDIKPITFEPFTPVTPDSDQLAEYRGVYRSVELNVGYRVLSQDGSLFLKTTYPSPDSLVPTIIDVFKIYDVGVIRFERDRGGRISGFSFTFGKVRNIAFAKIH